MVDIIVEIPNYIREVEQSKKRRTYYWEYNGRTIKSKNKELPNKYFKSTENLILNYGKISISDLKTEFTLVCIKGKTIYTDTNIDNWLTKKDCKVLLADSKTLQPIIANDKVAGKPKIRQIKGQDFYSGNLREHEKGTIMKAIQDSFRPYIKNIQPVIEYPIEIVCELHDTIKNTFDNTKESNELGTRWDIDNRMYPYLKAFPDVLYQEGKIIDDDRLHITIPPHAVFCPIKDENQRKLRFIIRKDKRECVNTKEFTKEYQENCNKKEIKKSKNKSLRIIKF